MQPDDRRKAIVSVLVPLIVERGGEVSTREIAEAAGIAEGTIFRVFPDKRSLMLAAAEEAINPAEGERDFEAAIAGLSLAGREGRGRRGARPGADAPDHVGDDGDAAAT